MRFFPALVRCMPVANSPRILIRWVEKELLNLLTGRYRSTADDTFFEKSRFSAGFWLESGRF